MTHPSPRNGLRPRRHALSRVAASAMIAALMFTAPSFAQSTAQPTRATTLWNLDKSTKLAIKGYDPIAYFSEGGGVATKGNPSITADYNGATYHFATDAHKQLFLANPARYEPAHGGWCSWAMKEGDKVEVDPTKFIVKDDRLFLFYDGFWGDTRAKWLKQDHAKQVATADEQWKKISGESARSAAPISATSELGGNATERPLEAKLKALADNFAKNASPESLEVFESGIKEVAESAVMTTALKAGQTAPDFSLPDIQGHTVRLSDLLKQGPVVLTWYRGGWCPFCNIQLREYQAHIEEFKAAGATLVAISPQKPDRSLATSNSNSLSFPVLSDADNKTASQYGLTYKLPDRVAQSFKGRLDLSEYNGSDTNELPITATYIITKDGTIAQAFLDADYRKRAEPTDVIQALKAIPPTK
ncbi:MAG: YHS domain-containing (seleno)protein [Phycisphaerales bacterium]